MKPIVDVIIVGGGPRGLSLIEAAKEYCVPANQLRFAGVVGDNPNLNVPGKGKRYTSYRQFDCYPEIIKATAKAMKIPYYDSFINHTKNEIKKGEFSDFEIWLYTEALNRKLGNKKGLRTIFIMACFGQRWRWPIIKLCNGWFFNTHPVAHGSVWGNDNPYRGTVPYETMHANGIKECDLIAHVIDNKFDCGIEATRVGPIELCEYNGREMYYRRGQNSGDSNEELQRVRFQEQGEFVYNMHLQNAFATRILAKELTTNKELIRCVLAGKAPTPRRMREFFPKRKVFQTQIPRSNSRTTMAPIIAM